MSPFGRECHLSAPENVTLSGQNVTLPASQGLLLLVDWGSGIARRRLLSASPSSRERSPARTCPALNACDDFTAAKLLATPPTKNRGTLQDGVSRDSTFRVHPNGIRRISFLFDSFFTGVINRGLPSFSRLQDRPSKGRKTALRRRLNGGWKKGGGGRSTLLPGTQDPIEILAT